MKNFLKNTFYAVTAAAMLSACSRPVATFQPSQRESFARQQPAVTTVVETAPANVVAQPTEAVAAVPASQVATPAQVQATVANAQRALAQAEASVANQQVSGSKRVTQRLARVQTMLASVATTSATNEVATTSTARKAGLVERLALKSIDKKIQKKLAPKAAKARSFLVIGLIAAAVGLLLVLIGNGFGVTLGIIALIGGAVLALLDLLDVI